MASCDTTIKKKNIIHSENHETRAHLTTAMGLEYLEKILLIIYKAEK